MKILFFFVHPSKVHVFKHTINQLIDKGHHVDITITSKDVLEDLVKLQGWNYTNIFPEGRKITGIPTLVGAGINAVRTIFRLLKYLKGKKFDLFITDDLLVTVGRLKGVPGISFLDDDLAVVPEAAFLLKSATHILAPSCTQVGRYSHKKIGFRGYKELAYLHPNHFTPDPSVVLSFNPDRDRYFLIRIVSLGATHDVGKKGVSNRQLQRLIDLLEQYGKVFISSERTLPLEFEPYRIRIKVDQIPQALYFAEMYLGDSQTMTSEAAVLGIPGLRFNDFVGKITVMEEKEEQYQLSYSFRTDQFELMLDKIRELLSTPNLKVIFQARKKKMLSEKIDLTAFLTWFFENYPSSAELMMADPDYQLRFQ
jgi:uncharacterized protein